MSTTFEVKDTKMESAQGLKLNQMVISHAPLPFKRAFRITSLAWVGLKFEEITCLII